MDCTFTRALLLICLCLSLPGAEPVSSALNQELPEWIRFGGEYRLRLEDPHHIRFQQDSNDFYALSRLRLNLQLTPAPYLKFFFQTQDARIFGNQLVSGAPPNANTFDLREAYVEFGDVEKRPVSLRAGRQELVYGEERLVGASNWSNTARTFDAVRLVLRHNGYRLDAFAASVVVAELDRFDHHRQGDNLHGLYGSAANWIPKARVEPYFFWRVAPRVRSEAGASGKFDMKTPGIRIAGDLPAGVDYVTEVAFQFGSYAGDEIRAWAGHWRASRKLGLGRWTPRLRLEYNYATGDRDPHDRKRETFDVLYPTPHDKYGLADQVGWRNIHHLAASLEAKPNERWTLQAKFHDRWLASARDGLYSASGTLLFRDPTGHSGRHVGKEVDLQAIWAPSRTVQIGTGIGHIFPGEFVRKVSPGRGYTWPYIAVTWTL